jgi:acyl carrier protein
VSDSSSDLTARVIAVAADVFGVPSQTLSAASTPETVEAWDSISHLNLMLSIEQAFEAAIPPERMSDLTSIEKLVTEIQRLVKA